MVGEGGPGPGPVRLHRHDQQARRGEGSIQGREGNNSYNGQTDGRTRSNLKMSLPARKHLYRSVIIYQFVDE